MALANIRAAFSVPFPARVQGIGGLKVLKANGIYTISPDFPALADVIPITTQLPFSQLWYYNTQTQTYSLITLSEIGALSAATPTQAPRIITAAGTVVISSTDTLVVLNKAAPSVTPITLPAVAARSPLGLPLEVYDFAGNGGDITFTPNGTEKIMGANATWVVGSGGAARTGGSLRLIPSVDLGGWLVR